MRVANRQMLTGEILAGLITASAGFSIWLSKGTLYQAFRQRGDNDLYSFWIGAPMATMGLVLFVVSMIEHVNGKNWGERDLLVFSRWRETLCIMLCLSHCSLFVSLLQLGAFWVAPAVTMNAIILINFFAFATFKAARLTHALDPRYPTENLRQEIRRT